MIHHSDVSDPKSWERIEDELVHLVVTSPPYDNLRTYGHGASWDFEIAARQLYKKLVKGGVCCWIVGDAVVKGSETLTSFRQALFFVDEVGFRMHDRMIYHKTNFSHPERVRYHQVFEDVFVLSKGVPRVFNPIMDKENVTAGWVGNLGRNTFTERNGSKSQRSKKVCKEFGMRGNVWTGKTRGQEDMCETMPHPAMMPKWLARDLILSWSNKGDTVLDPFVGSGTVTTMAKRLERVPIGMDISPEYVNLAQTSLENINPLFSPVSEEK
jgi:site-specific DNA-methyltransferase (adenine-specific)